MDKHEYTNGEITIVWQPKLCIHSAVCVRTLPQVYRPKERPWITIENATTADYQFQIPKCPSGALSYYLVDQSKTNTPTNSHQQNIVVDILKDGPYLVKGDFILKDKSGEKMLNKQVALCRCGASKNKPYCDGSHRTVGFTDES